MLLTGSCRGNHAVDTFAPTQAAGVFIACTADGNSAPQFPEVASR